MPEKKPTSYIDTTSLREPEQVEKWLQEMEVPPSRYDAGDLDLLQAALQFRNEATAGFPSKYPLQTEIFAQKTVDDLARAIVWGNKEIMIDTLAGFALAYEAGESGISGKALESGFRFCALARDQLAQLTDGLDSSALSSSTLQKLSSWLNG